MTIWGLPLHPGPKYYINVPADALLDSSGTPSDAFTYHFTAAGSLDLAHAARAGFQQLNAVELGRHGRNQTTVWDYVGIAQIERNGNPMV